MDWLAANNPDTHARLQTAQAADGRKHGPGFDAAWRQIAAENPDRFLKMQYDFSKQKYYDDAAAAIKDQTTAKRRGRSARCSPCARSGREDCA